MTKERHEMKRMTVPLYNLGCGGGRASLAERVLAQEPGVISVYANPATAAIYIEYDPALTSQVFLGKELARLGLGAPSSS